MYPKLTSIYAYLYLSPAMGNLYLVLYPASPKISPFIIHFFLYFADFIAQARWVGSYYMCCCSYDNWFLRHSSGKNQVFFRSVQILLFFQGSWFTTSVSQVMDLAHQQGQQHHVDTLFCVTLVANCVGWWHLFAMI